MEPLIPMAIVGIITLIIGIKMNLNPEAFNEQIFGKKIHESALGEANAMRMAIGGGILAISTIMLTTIWWNLEARTVEESTGNLMLSTAIGLGVFLATIAGAKFRGYTETIPKLPMIVLPLLILASLWGAEGANPF
tara:strand:- start:1572 stop:1979 length:408 start_codon:yes stop_codon:yes gene_type:complete